MFLNFLSAAISLAIFTLSICLRVNREKGFDKQSLNYYFTVIIPQSVFLSVIFVLFIASGNGSATYLVLGILIYTTGFFIRLKTFDNLKNNYNVSKEKMSDKIITNGIYNYIRHPLYLGTLFVYLGLCLMIFSKAGIMLYFIFLVPLFLIRIKKEEKEFTENTEYQKYKKETSQLIPFIY
ncbi:MAG: isoprenylcysteine carboxylmethyltransferase family protein [Patescibacteria group bacterium]|nr:isoprenylcysteine carboxylmethyltransferase family protein [Patescibacteria group bacterium]